MKKLLFLLLFLTLTSLHAGKITVATAANVSYAMDDLIKAFNLLHPETKVQVILGSSGKLTAQIMHGAPYDIFMSADMKYPETLYEKKLAVTKPIIYAEGTLSMLSQKKRNYSTGFFLLKDSSIKKIAIANPQTAPYGVATKEALENAKLYNMIKGKLIYGESISQTLSFSISAADIGIIATSALFSPRMKKYKKTIDWVEIDEELYTPIKQGIVILKEGEESVEVKDFYNFMLSKKAKKILSSFGYKVK